MSVVCARAVKPPLRVLTVTSAIWRYFCTLSVTCASITELKTRVSLLSLLSV